MFTTYYINIKSKSGCGKPKSSRFVSYSSNYIESYCCYHRWRSVPYSVCRCSNKLLLNRSSSTKAVFNNV